MKYFNDFDFSEFWFDDTDTSNISDFYIINAERELCYKLPESYIELIKMFNGGYVKKNCFPTKTKTTWAENHIAISNIMGIGGENDIVEVTKSMICEWEYPDIGVVICDCPSAGHDIIMLDYRECGKQGEPKVVHVDQEWDYNITLLAEDFEHFIKGLMYEEEFE